MALLFSRQLLNGSQDFFLINILIFIYFFKYETIETHARAFLTLNILAIGRVRYQTRIKALNEQTQVCPLHNKQSQLFFSDGKSDRILISILEECLKNSVAITFFR